MPSARLTQSDRISPTFFRKAGEIFIREDLSRDYDADSVFVANATAVAQFFAAGQPMKANGVFAAAADMAGGAVNVVGFVLNPTMVPPGGAWVNVISRGAGIEMIMGTTGYFPTVDPTGATMGGTVITNCRIAALRLGFNYRVEPTVVNEQTN